jgi:dihydrofolate reductase
MGELVYAAIASLDGYVADEHGNWDWSMPSEEVHAYVNDRTRGARTHLYGRRMYEVLVAWETMDLSGQPPFIRDFAEIWRGADKVVYSSTLEAVASARTRIERIFDANAVRELKSSEERDLTIGGPQLAAEALRAGLVDELHLFAAPVVVGGGNAWLPDDLRLDLELLHERRFDKGVVYGAYGIERAVR